MKYPIAVKEKAQRMEELLQRVAAGEALSTVCAEMEITVTEKQLSAMQARYEAGGRKWEALVDGRFGHEQKVNSAIREWMYERKRQDKSVRAGQLAQEIEEKFSVQLSIGHVNYLLRQRELAAPPGRPLKKRGEIEETESIQNTSLEQAGLFFPGSSQV
ncbi:MAG: hypothetical protein ABIG63_17765 [Chloroflexota bacterium]